MTWYVSVTANQEPHDFGVVDGRVQFGFNVTARKRSSNTFIQDIIKILVEAGVGVENVNIFGSSLAVIPDPMNHPGPVLHVQKTAGLAPEGTHNDGPGAYRRPGAMIIVRAATSPAAEAMAQAAFDALISVRNREVA